MAEKQKGYIYILTNPSFPIYVKIGYADNMEARLKSLNRSESIPYAFRVYATYEVSTRLTDFKVHNMIDKLNPDLRCVENINGRKRVREFYAMSPEDAYSIFEAMAQIHGTEEKLKKWKMTDKEVTDQEEAIENEKNSKTGFRQFTFSECHIAIGEELQYIKDKKITCVVCDDRHVEYNGEVMSLTGLARFLLGRSKLSRNDKGYHINGPTYFLYKGETISDLYKKNKRD